MCIACIYFKPNINESTISIQSKIDTIVEKYIIEYPSIKILVETDEFSQLDIFLNREIDKYNALILCRPIVDEFYNLVLEELHKQGQLKIIQVD